MAKRKKSSKRSNSPKKSKRKRDPKGLRNKKKRAQRRQSLKRHKPRSSKKDKLGQSRLPADDSFKTAFKFLRQGQSQKRSAELAGVSTKRFRRYLRENKLARFQSGKWSINDRRPRSIRIFTDGQSRTIKVRGFNRASLAMKHRAAVRRFLESNEASELAPFHGLSVTDTFKQKHVLETRPNVLYRLANAGSDAEMKIYRLLD